MSKLYPLYGHTTFRGIGEILPSFGLYHIGLINPLDRPVDLFVFSFHKQKEYPKEFFVDQDWYEKLNETLKFNTWRVKGIYILSSKRGQKTIFYKYLDPTGRVTTTPVSSIYQTWTIQGYVDYYQYGYFHIGIGHKYEITLEPKEKLDIYFLIDNR